MTRRRIAIVTPDVVADRMAGPAIRAWNIARVIGRDHDVELFSTRRCDRASTSFRCGLLTRGDAHDVADSVDAIVVQGDVLRTHPALRRARVPIVVDLYDPFHLEVLEQTRGMEPLERRAAVGTAIDVVNEQLRRGDFFLCASERQRDFWLGQLAGAGRLNERSYDHSPDLRRLVAVVPFGVDDAPPVHERQVLRGVVPGIEDGDDVILWGGGIYNWFDPLSLLHAVDRLRARRPRVRLFFAGVQHPNPAVPQMEMNARARALAGELGLVGTHVFFHGWIDYGERQNVLLESDLGVSTHHNHVETDFSFRTRILDHLWAGLPTVATAGDVLGERIAAADAGLTVPPEDVDALCAALATVLEDDAGRVAMAEAARSLGAQLRWSNVTEPLAEFCAGPVRAPDLLASPIARSISRGGNLMPSELVAAGRRAADLARRGEWQQLGDKARRRLGRAPGGELDGR
jgi:glycosyltransferase involved in cell wall biosynthesis